MKMEDNRLDAVPALVKSTASLLDCVRIDGRRLLKLETEIKSQRRRSWWLLALIIGLVAWNFALSERIDRVERSVHRLPTWEPERPSLGGGRGATFTATRPANTESEPSR